MTTFLCDVLMLLKSFQKNFEGDLSCIAYIPAKRTRLFERLNNLLIRPLENGWEELLLKEIVQENGKDFLHGHELISSSGRARRATCTPIFTTNDRKKIIETLISNLNVRLNIDIETEELLTPLFEISQGIDRDLLEQSHTCIIPDLDFSELLSEYSCVSTLFSYGRAEKPSSNHHQDGTRHIISFSNPENSISSNRRYQHSADVERMLSTLSFH